VKTTLRSATFSCSHAATKWQHVIARPGGQRPQIPCRRPKLFEGCTSVTARCTCAATRRTMRMGALGNEGGLFRIPRHYKRHRITSVTYQVFTESAKNSTYKSPRKNNLLAHGSSSGVEAGHQRTTISTRRQEVLEFLTYHAAASVSSSRAFLHPALGRNNLRVFAIRWERINLREPGDRRYIRTRQKTGRSRSDGDHLAPAPSTRRNC